ncbi:MAG TPA: FdtA/QdtA family cupin domain-containing protein [Candidatus Gracilibacteria bacterium]
MTTKYRLIEFPYFSDDRGDLIPFELDSRFPFEVKRVYLVTGNDGQVRGGHAHKIEDELFVAASGSITALVNDGVGDHEILLDAKNKALVVRKDCWHEFYNFSPDAVMLCFSSTHYLPGEGNYIMNKEDFLSRS